MGLKNLGGWCCGSCQALLNNVQFITWIYSISPALCKWRHICVLCIQLIAWVWSSANTCSVAIRRSAYTEQALIFMWRHCQSDSEMPYRPVIYFIYLLGICLNDNRNFQHVVHFTSVGCIHRIPTSPCFFWWYKHLHQITRLERWLNHRYCHASSQRWTPHDTMII